MRDWEAHINLETIKTLGLRPRAFICFSVFGYPDETLALVVDILHDGHTKYISIISNEVVETWAWRSNALSSIVTYK